MRVIVCGGRDYTDARRVLDFMDELHKARPIAILFHGNARGADLLGEAWADLRGVKSFAVPAQWSKYGNAAGPKRNQEMLSHGVDLVVAFPGGRGTADMVRRARAAGVAVAMVVSTEPAPDREPAGGAGWDRVAVNPDHSETRLGGPGATQ